MRQFGYSWRFFHARKTAKLSPPVVEDKYRGALSAELLVKGAPCSGRTTFKYPRCACCSPGRSLLLLRTTFSPGRSLLDRRRNICSDSPASWAYPRTPCPWPPSGAPVRIVFVFPGGVFRVPAKRPFLGVDQ